MHENTTKHKGGASGELVGRNEVSDAVSAEDGASDVPD